MPSSSMLSLRPAILSVIVAAAALLSAIPGIQRFSIAVVVGGVFLLGWLSIRFIRDAARHKVGSDELRRLNETLEARIEARTADLRDSNARMRSIIDSAVSASS